MQGSFSIHSAARRAMRTEGIMGPSEQHPDAIILPDGSYFPHRPAPAQQQPLLVEGTSRNPKRQLDTGEGDDAESTGAGAEGVRLGALMTDWITSILQSFGAGNVPPLDSSVISNYRRIFSQLNTISGVEYEQNRAATIRTARVLALINDADTARLNRYLPLYMLYNSVLLELSNATLQLQDGIRWNDTTFFSTLANNSTNFFMVEPVHVDKGVLRDPECLQKMLSIYQHICNHLHEKHKRMVVVVAPQTELYTVNMRFSRTYLVGKIVHYMMHMMSKTETSQEEADRIYCEWSSDCLRRYPAEAAPDTPRPVAPYLDTDRRDSASSGGWWHKGAGFLPVGPYFLSLRVVLYLLRFTQLEAMSSSRLGKLVKMVHSNGTVELATWFMVTTCIHKQDFWFDSLALMSDWAIEKAHIAQNRGKPTLDEDEEDDLTGRMARLILSSVGVHLQDLDIPLQGFHLRSLDDPCLWLQGLWALVPSIRKGNRLDEVLMSSDTEMYKMLLTKAPATLDDFRKKVLNFLRPCGAAMLRYIDECCSNEARVILEAESMRLDLYYAQMVKGAIANSSINRGVVWTSSELVDVTDDVSSKLDDILPKVAMQILESIRPKEFYSREFIDYGSGSGGGNKRMVSGRDVLGVVQRLKDMKVAITDVWSQSRRFRVSDEVHMVELEVLHRLKRDGLVQWFEDPEATKLTHLEICNWFRRNDLTRAKFACVVGRRMLSTRQVTASQGGRGNSGSIMAHQRAVAWAETEYIDFCRFVCEHADTIERACTPRNVVAARADPLFHDYAQLATKDLHSEMVRNAKDNVRREFLNPQWSGGAA